MTNTGMQSTELTPAGNPLALTVFNNDQALNLLRQLLPNQPDATFLTPQQREMVMRSLQRERSFVGILPTGGGKSLTFLIPALAEEDYLTLVAIPNKALLNYMLHKTQDLGIPTCQWTAKHQHIGDSRIV
jgi:superfamily II DNA helicase RecQ